MVSINSIRQGSFITLNSQFFQVLAYSHIKMGRGGAVIKIKLKNLDTGSITEKSFNNSDSVEEAVIERTKASYLYSNQAESFFMDSQTFETYEISNQKIAESKKFLKEGVVVQILKSDNKIINIELPIKEVYKITNTPPGIKGDTVSGGSKPATLETGAVINVPLFIKIDDKVRVN